MEREGEGRGDYGDGTGDVRWEGGAGSANERLQHDYQAAVSAGVVPPISAAGDHSTASEADGHDAGGADLREDASDGK